MQVHPEVQRMEEVLLVRHLQIAPVAVAMVVEDKEPTRVPF